MSDNDSDQSLSPPIVNKRGPKRAKGGADDGKPRKRGRPIGANAARERSRVQTLKSAFLELQKTLPSVPPDTKLSKLDVLVLATTYISHLMKTLDDGTNDSSTKRETPSLLPARGYLHPVKV